MRTRYQKISENNVRDLDTESELERLKNILDSLPHNIFDVKEPKYYSIFDIKEFKYVTPYTDEIYYFQLRKELFKNSRLHTLAGIITEFHDLINPNVKQTLENIIYKHKLIRVREMTRRNKKFFKQCNDEKSEIKQLTIQIEKKKLENVSSENVELSSLTARLYSVQKSYHNNSKIRSQIRNWSKIWTKQEAESYGLEYWSDEKALNDIYDKFKEIEQKLKNLWIKRYQLYTEVLLEQSESMTFKFLQDYEDYIYSQFLDQNLDFALSFSSYRKNMFIKEIKSFYEIFISFCNNYKPTNHQFFICENCENLCYMKYELQQNDDKLDVFIPMGHYQPAEIGDRKGYCYPDYLNEPGSYQCDIMNQYEPDWIKFID